MAIPETSFEVFKMEAGHWNLVDRFGGRERETAMYAVRLMEQRDSKVFVKVVKSSFDPERGVWDELIIHRSPAFSKFEQEMATQQKEETPVEKFVAYQLSGGRWTEIREFKNAGADLHGFIAALTRSPPPNVIRIMKEIRTRGGKALERQMTFEALPKQPAGDMPPMPGEAVEPPTITLVDPRAKKRQAEEVFKFFTAIVLSLLAAGVVAGLVMLVGNIALPAETSSSDNFRLFLLAMFVGSAVGSFPMIARAIGTSADDLVAALSDSGVQTVSMARQTKLIVPDASSATLALPELPPMEDADPNAEMQDEPVAEETATTEVVATPAPPPAAAPSPPEVSAPVAEPAPATIPEPTEFSAADATREILQVLSVAIIGLKNQIATRDAVSDRFIGLLAAGAVGQFVDAGRLRLDRSSEVLKSIQFISAAATDGLTRAALAGELSVDPFDLPLRCGAQIAALTLENPQPRGFDLAPAFLQYRDMASDLTELHKCTVIATLVPATDLALLDVLDQEARRRPGRFNLVGQPQPYGELQVAYYWAADTAQVTPIVVSALRQAQDSGSVAKFGIGLVEGSGVSWRGRLYGTIAADSLAAARLSRQLGRAAVLQQRFADGDRPIYYALNPERAGVTPTPAAFSPLPGGEG